MTTLSAGQTLKKSVVLFMAAFFVSISEEFSFRTSVQAATKCLPGAIHPCKMFPNLCSLGNGLCAFKSPCEYECKCPPLWTRHRTCVGVGGAAGSIGSGSNSNSNTDTGSTFSEPVGSLVDSLLINPPDLFWDINHVSKPGEPLSMTPTTTIATVIAATGALSATETPSPTRAATTSQTSPSTSAAPTPKRQASTESSTMQKPSVTNTKIVTTKAPQNSRTVNKQQSSPPSDAIGSQSGTIEVASTNDQSAASQTPGSATNDPSPSHIANPLSASSLSALLDPPSTPPAASPTQSRQNIMSGTGTTSAILSAIAPQRDSSASTGSSTQSSQNLQGIAVSASRDQTAKHSSNIEAIIANSQSLTNPGTTSHGASVAASTNEPLPPTAKDPLSPSSSTVATVAKAAAKTASSKETAVASQQPSLPTSSNTNEVPTRQTTETQPSLSPPPPNAASNVNTITTTISTTTVQATALHSTAAPTTMSNTGTKTTSSESPAKNMPTAGRRDHPSLFEHQDSFPTLFSELPNPPAPGDPQNAPLSTVIHRVFHPVGGLRFKVKR